MKQEEIEWMLFEFAEGNLSGEEFIFWKNQIQENPEIAKLYELLKSTYLTTSTLPKENLHINTNTPQPLSDWGNNLIYTDKQGLKQFPNAVQFKNKSFSHRELTNVPIESNALKDVSKKHFLTLFRSAFTPYSTAAAIILLGFIVWNWMYQTPNTQPATVTAYVVNKMENSGVVSNKLSSEKSLEQSQTKNEHPAINLKINSQKSPTNLLAGNSQKQSADHTMIVPKSEKNTHPLISATENYHSTIAQASQIKNNRESYSSQYNIELSSNLQQTPANQQFTNVDETVITLVHTQPVTGKSKRQFMAYNVKEMMRKGQLPNIKIQPIKEEKVGLIPPFRFELDINQVPVYQTSNH